MSSLASFQNIHKGETVIVCGCGESLNELQSPERFITIGVNDVGRLFDPTYLVVLNPRQQFKGDRFRYVETSRAKAIFTQLDLGINHPHIVRFKLGKRGGTDISDPDTLPYTHNSPYVALCLAAYMGAKHIGLIGVDFTDNHFFGNTGRHPLSGQIHQINREYDTLAQVCAQMNIEVLNLSKQSLLTAFRKGDITSFISITPIEKNLHSHKTIRVKKDNTARRVTMRIAIEKHKPGIVGDFLEGLAKTASKLGHEVSRNPIQNRARSNVISIVWNGRNFSSSGKILYCEHGWLPRWAYQISMKGINADSHIAPFQWNNIPLSAQEETEVDRYMEELRKKNDISYGYMNTNAPAVNDLPEAFLLVPLQIEHDTNIVRHVPKKLCRMQAFIDYVSHANPPYPVVYKQHPADRRRMNQHLGLRLRRKQDIIRRHDEGNIHQLLKSKRCKGIISLNSNVVHDGLLWDVPSVVLGKNIWPEKGVSPFINEMPEEWKILDDFFYRPHVTACRKAYIQYLMNNQWTLADSRDEIKVCTLLQKIVSTEHIKSRSSNVSISKSRIKKKKVVNVLASNRGWLFEDLKSYFRNIKIDGVDIFVSETPTRNASSWIYLRAHEVISTPDPARTLVQIHDLYDNGYYKKGGRRAAVATCGAVALTNPAQQTILEANGIDLSNKEVINIPLGASKCFTLRKRLSDIFTIGWVGRPVVYKGKDIKRVEWLVKALQAIKNKKDNLRIILLGERLNDIKTQISKLGIECRYLQRSENPFETYPSQYHQFDCVVITSKFAAGPNCLYEALESGVPVISTPAGWAPELIQDDQNGYLVESIQEITNAVEEIRSDREVWFNKREIIQDSMRNYSLESWIEANIHVALNLTNRN